MRNTTPIIMGASLLLSCTLGYGTLYLLLEPKLHCFILPPTRTPKLLTFATAIGFAAGLCAFWIHRTTVSLFTKALALAYIIGTL